MDPAALAGIVLCFVCIMVSTIMEGGSPMSMLKIPAIILVFGGTIGACLASGMLKDTIGAVKAAIAALTAKAIDSNGVVDDIVKLAERARREGLLALEDASKDIDNDFLKKGLQMAIDGTDPDELREILEAEITAKKGGDKASKNWFNDAGAYGPTIGIIGTVMGLVHVLENLDKPETLGESISGAFIATLWGVCSANVLWFPIGKRIARISELQCAEMELVVEGILAIQAGSNPRVVAQKLKSLLPGGGEVEKKAA
ncbi:chemotaxis protein MotA [Motilibacter peucedani]|uniref:Chemotaxis protein MotA n=1 Tax=Motilibacter peucedani TaxID=598650 RepID=A0A420XTF8_9ACTN|nr:MotA/TolQ/ExbB proton channel family protein [Motilibacter peucedani]RKS80125.1 chemotaxis protein MotA [Motilibacter peucedani]